MIVEIKKDAGTYKFNRHWQFSAGSPHATYALRRDWFEQLKIIHSELGIERVRFHGIFCDDMHTLHKLSDLFPIPGGNKVTEKSFRYPSVAYDNILDAGMKPFVELSFMPRHLAKKNKKGMFFYKPNISPPGDLSEWGGYVESFVRFLCDRYGNEEIETWYFEVWNEPDLRLPFFAGTKKDYFRLYAETARAVKRVNSRIRVGGPSTSGSKWLPEFLGYCRENDVPVDFVTTHQYAGDPLGGIDGSKEKAKININPFAALGKNRKESDSLLSVFRRLMATDKVYSTLKRDNLIKSAENARKQAGDKPLFYTEWNLCASFSAECNDTRMAASYNVHSILGTADTIDGSSVWCFTDLFEELHPFSEEFHGGFGMLTGSGIKKPVFHALRMLNEVSDDRMEIVCSEGDTTAAAFLGDGEIQIILTLCVPDGTKKAECIDICIESDKAPECVTAELIDENNGNPLRIWKEMGAPQVPTKAEIQMISEKSSIAPSDMPFEYTDGKILTRITLRENDIALIRVKG